jgi:hypothetical protein
MAFLGTCPWCITAVRSEGTAGMEPVADGGRYWHQGCLADLVVSAAKDAGVE